MDLFFFNGTLTAQNYREEILAPFVNQLEENEIENFFTFNSARADTASEMMNMLREVF